eukprot:TRINITY_DN10399_c0_g1_i3.p1 TRINITY_DN10399_c0_g1~~TRINITY_DN10399_c0_g1_i3.p1  ORF type:complete len:245 (+),score=35.99 TRINITY_DN10399_c0_g1_i3:224-958(+)
MKRSSLCTTSDTDYPSSNSQRKYMGKIKGSKERNSTLHTANKRPWTTWEHERYLRGLTVFGTNWKKLAEYIKSKEPLQVKSHHQRVTMKEKNQCFGSYQAAIYEYIESNCDFTYAKMKKSAPPKETTELLISSELLEYIYSKSYVPFSSSAPFTLEIALYVAAELMKDEIRLPIESNSPSQSVICEEGDEQAQSPKAEHRKGLNHRIRHTIDAFNEFPGPSQHLSLIHICRCRRLLTCRSRWSP